MRVSNTQPNQLPIWASGQSRTDRLNKVVCKLMYGCRHGTNNHCDILINHCMYMHNHDVVMPPKFNWQCILLQFSLISVYLQSFTKTWCNASRVTYRRPHARERWKLDYKPTNNPVQIGIPIKPVGETRRTRSKIPVMTITNAAINCKGETNPRSRRGDRIAMMIIKEVSHAKALGTSNHVNHAMLWSRGGFETQVIFKLHENGQWFRMRIEVHLCAPINWSPSLGARNYPIFLSRRFHRPIHF